MKKCIEPNEKCSACGACIDRCTIGAISFLQNKDGYVYPVVDKDKCIGCGMCASVCSINTIYDNQKKPKRAYIARSIDAEIYSSSSSGGIFGEVALWFLKNNGIVYGASIINENGKLYCRHIGIKDKSDLHKLQGSKYLHSETQGVFSEIKRLLDSDTLVFFTGTSCQVYALRLFLGKEYGNLFTADLVCHGVLPTSFFHSYLEYLQSRFICTVQDISFRRKKAPGFETTGDSYVLTLTCVDNRGNAMERYISRKTSEYYQMFLNMAGYRPNCYDCKYACLSKVGDITLGDFSPKKDEIKKYELDLNYMISTILINTSKGEKIIDSISNRLWLKGIDDETVLRHHPNLRKPSEKTKAGIRLQRIYRIFGFQGLHYYIITVNFIKSIFSTFKRYIQGKKMRV